MSDVCFVAEREDNCVQGFGGKLQKQVMGE